MKLYSINTPCWSDYDPHNTSNTSLIKDKLSDHFTFMYYNFLKYGLVDEVLIFLEEKRINRGIVDQVFETEHGKMTILSSEKIKEMDLEKGQIVYCWSKWEDCSFLKDNFVIVNPMFSGRTYPSCFSNDIHDFALIEGKAFEDTVPSWMPHKIFRYTTKDFCEITDKQRNESRKFYDWIMVSSFDPRKRHIEFINEITKYKETLGLRGCIVGRNPDNKGYENPGHVVLRTIKELVKKNNLDVDIFMNVDQDTKKDLLMMSKVFVCASSLDNGPRAMVEATQAGLPLLSMSHIGSSDLIEKSITGEIPTSISEFPLMLMKILDNYESYDKHKNAKLLMPENVFPKIIKEIREKKDDKLEC